MVVNKIKGVDGINTFKIKKPSGHNPSDNKHKFSCIACRTAKRKCTRDITGCYNCSRFRKPCVYLTEDERLMMNEQKKIKLEEDTDPLKSTEQMIMEHNSSEFIKHSTSPPENQLRLDSNFFLNTLGFSHLSWQEMNQIQKPVISKQLALTFIEAYFKHNHRSYPFICQSAFLRQFNQFDTLNDTITNYFEFEIYMIMNIGCTTLSRAKLLDQEDIYSKYFFNKCIGFLLREYVVDELESIKILLFLCIYSFFEPQGIQTWNLFGLVIRTSTTLGLNQRTKSPDLTLENIEMRNRLFWSIYNMDRLLSISLGRPLSIDEMDIDLDLPRNIFEEDNFTFKTIVAIIKLRKIEGTITKQIYSLKAREFYKEDVIQTIKDDLELWISNNKPNNSENSEFLSFHGSADWFYSRYYHNLMLLYRPSYLIPKPNSRNLEFLSRYCLESLSRTHKLFKSNLLPLNWITLYRFLIVCSSTLYCLCNWTIDLNKSKLEIDLLIEILNAFSENWGVASKCSKVFQNIVDNIFQIFLTSDGKEVTNINQLSNELLGASSAYHEILNNNSIDIAFTSMIQDEFLS